MMLSVMFTNHVSLFLRQVTADGSIDCADKPGEQEDLTSALHYSEVAAALNILQPGGHLVLKTFTLFEDHSVSLMYILRSCFDKVSRPSTQKKSLMHAHAQSSLTQLFFINVCVIGSCLVERILL